MKNSKLKIVFLLVFVLLIGTFIVPVSAAEYNLGVSVGQYVKYGDYVLTTPAETVISPDWSMIEVIGVNGKEVTLRITGAYMNGTAIPTSTIVSNIETGMTGGFQRYIIAANLNEGDKILNMAVSDTINTTETRTVLGASRSVNILNFTGSYPGQNIKIVYLYDQASGMQIGMDMESTIIAQAVTYTNSYTIIDTNIFEVEPIPEGLTFAVMALLTTVSMLVGYRYFVKRKETTVQ